MDDLDRVMEKMSIFMGISLLVCGLVAEFEFGRPQLGGLLMVLGIAFFASLLTSPDLYVLEDSRRQPLSTADTTASVTDTHRKTEQ